jgi:hypothetical protein
MLQKLVRHWNKHWRRDSGILWISDLVWLQSNRKNSAEQLPPASFPDHAAQLQLFRSTAYSARLIMKMHLLFNSWLMVGAASLLVFRAAADPILPYQQPIAEQLTNDINSGTGHQRTFASANDVFNRRSRSLYGDISILRDLNSLLHDEPNYPTLIKTAADNYLADFRVRSADLAEQLLPAPRSSTKRSARDQLSLVDRSLANAAAATSTSSELSFLATATTRMIVASNTIRRALRQPVGLSGMTARIGFLDFTATRGFIAGGTNFLSTEGTGNGVFTPTTGTFDITAVDNGAIVRSIHLHVEGIGTNTPATYPLGVGENSAYYRATDLAHRREYHFDARSEMTNSLVTNAWVTFDFIGSNYVLLRFAFNGTNSRPLFTNDPNTRVTVSSGDAQLNFSHP